VIHTPTTPDCL